MWTAAIGRRVTCAKGGLASRATPFSSANSCRLKRAFIVSTFQRKKSHYEILEVASNADAKTIKKAFMKKAKIYHPDVAGDKFDKKVFQEILTAYETLVDPVRRESYDLGLHNPAFNEDEAERYKDNVKEGMGNPNNLFYNNKWYGFRKPNDDLRFEYMYKSEEVDFGEILRNNYVKLGLVIGSVILYDVYWYWQRKQRAAYVQAREEILTTGDNTIGMSNMTPVEEYVLRRSIGQESMVGSGRV